jgi:hypothetical protein
MNSSSSHPPDRRPPDLRWADYQARRALAYRDAPRLRTQAINATFAALRQRLTGLLASARRATPKRPIKEQQPCLR